MATTTLLTSPTVLTSSNVFSPIDGTKSPISASKSPVKDVSEFESEAWNEATTTFRNTSGHTKDRLNRFLEFYTSPTMVKKTCLDKTQEYSAQYGQVLSKILGKIDMFIRAGNLAVKAAPESVGLAWTGISLALSAAQDDFQTFQVFGRACIEIISILITCRVFTKMFGEPTGPEDFKEIQDKVRDSIPKTYGQILEFSYQMWKYSGENKALRIAKGLLRKNKSSFESQFQGIRDGEKDLSGYATKATEALTLYYNRQSLENQGKMKADLDNIKASLDSSVATSKEFYDYLKKELEAQKNRTPMDIAQETFKKQRQQLNRCTDVASIQKKRSNDRGKDTCQWIFEVDEYKTWRDSASSDLLWIFGGGNMGKSFLVSSIVDTLEENAKGDEKAFTQFFFCRNDDNDAKLTDRIFDQILCGLYQEVPNSLEALDKCNEAVKQYLAKGAPGPGNVLERDKEDDKTISFDDAFRVVVEVLKKKVYLIVDALDECSDREKREFIAKLKKLVSRSGVPIKVLISSRPEDDISEGFNGVPQINIRKHNEEDIDRVVRSMLEDIPGMTTTERADARSAITERAGPFFGYINPAIETLRKPWQRPLKNHLDTLPNDLLDMNAQIFTRIDPSYIGFLKTCLTWSILANGEQRVRVDEVVDAYSQIYLDGDSEWAGHDFGAEQITFYKLQIQKAGSAFLEVDNVTREISLIKPAIVKDSFLKKEYPKLAETGPEITCVECRIKKEAKRGFVLTERDGHLDIARTIFRHLNSSLFCKLYLSDSVEEETKNDENVERLEEVVIVENVENENVEQKQDNETDGPTEQKLSNEEENLEKPNGELTANINVIVNDTEQSDGANGTDLPQNPEEPEATMPESTHPDGEATTNGDVSKIDENPQVSENAEETTNGEVTSPEPSPAQIVPDLQDEDDLESEADSDFAGDDLTNAGTYVEDEKPKISRYELSQCIYHLQKVEELWKDSPKTEQLDALWADVEKFFASDSKVFNSFLSSEVNTKLWNGIGYNDEACSASPLHLAASMGLVELTRRLIQRGDDIHAETNIHRQPLHFAALLKTADVRLEICRLLLEKGANPNPGEFNAWGPPFHVLLFCNGNVDTVSLFLKHGAKADVLDCWGFSSLHNYACTGNEPEVVKLVVEHGADINAEDTIGETPLHKLVSRDDYPMELLEAFLEAHADVNKDDNDSQQPLFEVSAVGKVEAVKVLLKHGADVHDEDKDKWTALHNAASFGHEETVRVLIESNADPTLCDNVGRNPFHLACRSGNIDTVRYLGGVLLERDPSLIDMPTDLGKTPFRIACSKGNIEIAKYLLKELPVVLNVDAIDNRFKRTALHVAAYLGLYETADFLISNQAKTDLLDWRKRSALDLACEIWDARGPHDPANEDYENIILKLIDLDRQTAVGNMELLHAAASKGSLKILKKLIHGEPKADPNVRDEYGWTAIDQARQYGQAEAEKMLLARDGVVGRFPSAWKSIDPKRIVVSDDGAEIWRPKERYAVDPYFMPNWISLFSNHPIPSGTQKYYYEITVMGLDDVVVVLGPVLAFGLSQYRQSEAERRSWLPGHDMRNRSGVKSWGYHADDGMAFESCGPKGPSQTELETYGIGDTLGCGVDFTKGALFFTKNGRRLVAKTFTDVSGRLHCTIGTGSPLKVQANFTGKDFKWKPGNTLDFDLEENIEEKTEQIEETETKTEAKIEEKTEEKTQENTEEKTEQIEAKTEVKTEQTEEKKDQTEEKIDI